MIIIIITMHCYQNSNNIFDILSFPRHQKLMFVGSNQLDFFKCSFV